MAKSTPFALVVELAAKTQLDALRSFEKAKVIAAIDANLLHQPLLATRKRKSLGAPNVGLEYDPPLWQLSVEQLRIFYTVNEQTRTVHIRSVLRKPPHKTTEEIAR